MVGRFAFHNRALIFELIYKEAPAHEVILA